MFQKENSFYDKPYRKALIICLPACGPVFRPTAGSECSVFFTVFSIVVSCVKIMNRIETNQKQSCLK
ncbi:hypothetical protein HMPREF1141_2904 [Clostridium sp. MSTE9]|nr:hypothetical protein HMPREF1141_2904 [Clostridium sp. MSTE9]